MSEERAGRLSAAAAKHVANEHLRVGGSRLTAVKTSRSVRYDVWLIDYQDPAMPDVVLDGGFLVVTDDGHVYDVGSVPGSLDDVMLALGRWPGAEPADVADLVGPRTTGRPATDTDAEALLLLADEDPHEAAALAAWATDRRRERGE